MLLNKLDGLNFHTSYIWISLIFFSFFCFLVHDVGFLFIHILLITFLSVLPLSPFLFAYFHHTPKLTSASHPQKPLDLYLPEGGGLTLATATLLKEMHSVGKNNILNPGYLFGQVRSARWCSDLIQLLADIIGVRVKKTNQGLKKKINHTPILLL